MSDEPTREEIEAAARAWSDDSPIPESWENMSEPYRELIRGRARLALIAAREVRSGAAIKAEAWDEGWDAAVDAAERCNVAGGDSMCGSCAICNPPNPYRVTLTAAREVRSEAEPDVITRLPDRWMDEADQHTRDGFLGIAEGLRSAATELTEAIRHSAARRR